MAIDGRRKILVTGGAGFIGHHLVQRLARDPGLAVTVVDNLHRGSRATLEPGVVEFRHLDIRDQHGLGEIMQECEVVFHLAAQSSVMGAMEDREYSYSTNVLGTVNVLEAARRAKVKRVVFSSSREVYGEPESIPVAEIAGLRPKNHYGETKTAGETSCREFARDGLEVSVLRLANVYGPGDSGRVIPLFVEQALRGLPLVLYDGSQVVDFVWIGIVVDALARAGFREFLPEPTNVGSGKGTTVADLARRILQLTQSRSSLQISERRHVEVSRFVADITRAQAVLGLPAPEDPLFALDEVIQSAAGALGLAAPA